MEVMVTEKFIASLKRKLVITLEEVLQNVIKTNTAFETSIVLSGSMFLGIDDGHKSKYIIDEKVCRTGGNAFVFMSSSSQDEFYSLQTNRNTEESKETEEIIEIETSEETVAETKPEHDDGENAVVKEETVTAKPEHDDGENAVVKEEKVTQSEQFSEVQLDISNIVPVSVSEQQALDIIVPEPRLVKDPVRKRGRPRKVYPTITQPSPKDQPAAICPSSVVINEESADTSSIQSESPTRIVETETLPCTIDSLLAATIGEEGEEGEEGPDTDLPSDSHEDKANIINRLKRRLVDKRPVSNYTVFNKKGKKSTIEKLYKCEYCGKCFGDNTQLKTHLNTHTGSKPHRCDVCHVGFADRGYLTKHKRIHSGEKPYPCNICGKTFRVSNSLAMHYRIHTGERPYKCSTCGKAFKQNGQLIYHKRIHTGEKAFVCDLCGMKFARDGNLQQHKFDKHNNIKEHTCEHCGMCFKRKSHMINHARLHTGDTPFMCRIEGCKKMFTHDSTRYVHESSHGSKKPFVCETCGKNFSSRGVMNRHQKKHTPDEVMKTPKPARKKIKTEMSARVEENLRQIENCTYLQTADGLEAIDDNEIREVYVKQGEEIGEDNQITEIYMKNDGVADDTEVTETYIIYV